MIKSIEGKVWHTTTRFNGTICQGFHAKNLVLAFNKKWW